MSESDLKREMKEYIESVGGFWSVVANGAYAKIGDPDMIVCYKGFYIAIEGKTLKGTMSGFQKTRETEINRAGGIYICARSLDSLKKVIQEVDKWTISK